MTTDHEQRVAALSARRTPRLTPQRQATIGKILATGLTSTTVFGITAALGWSASVASNDTADKVVFDQATGVITAYRNGQVVSSQQVATPAARSTSEPTTVSSDPSGGFPALAPPFTAAPVLAPPPTGAPSTVAPMTSPTAITIPVAIPAPQPAQPAPPPQASSSGSN